MLVIPAIDIRGGRCVRLLQGDPDRETVYSDDPVKMAKSFEDMGAKLIHVVDLDGAFEGKSVNRELIINIAHSISIPIETGGGLRSKESIQAYVDAGIKRLILGSVILDDAFAELAQAFSEYIIAGIDAKDGMVAVKGWKDVSKISTDEAIGKVISLGVNEVIHTDISTDGMLTGPNVDAYKHILTTFPGIRLIASGGISSMEDLISLSKLPVHGAITGKAVYDGRINLKEVFEKF